MTEIFGKAYAEAYDQLYRDKDYDAEVALLERVFKIHGSAAIRRVLDLGCGTGNHALRLAARSFEVVGVDRSAEMLTRAEEKSKEQHLKVKFHHGTISELHLAETFDAAVMMFAVLGYHHSNDEVLEALRAARACIRTGGILAFDVWYGPAVLIQKPGERVRVIEAFGGSTLRATTGWLDPRQHLCRVDFRLWRIHGNKVTDQVTETHLVRYFFPKELELFLSLTGFEILRLGAFPDFDREPDDTTWNVLVVAQAV